MYIYIYIYIYTHIIPTGMHVSEKSAVHHFYLDDLTCQVKGEAEVTSV